MADSLADIKKDRKFWQRMLRFAGYYDGAIDGILGTKSKAAAAAWDEDAQRIKEVYGTFDERSESNISTLIPQAQRAARVWCAEAVRVAKESGFDVRIICGTRTYKEQDALYAKRPRVTKARGGQSMHNFGLAWDFGVFQGKTYFGDSPMYAELGKLYKLVPSVEWGGTWKSFVDQPHLQLNKYPNTAAARAAFES